jgi:hypothetical protein
MPLDLVVPELLAPPDAPPEMRALRLPALERWLAAAQIERKAGGAAQWLAERFALPSPAPAAPITLAAEAAGVSAGAWLRADPAHVRIGQGSAALVTGARLAIEPAEADALTAALSAHFRDDGLVFTAAAADRWYVRVPEGELPESSAQNALDVRALGSRPTTRGRVNWRGALTEAQMLLSSHEVNAAREARGVPAINSVWLWGGGTWPVKVASPYAVVCASEPFARGLGIASGARVRDLPREAAGLAPEGGATLAVIDGLAAPAAQREIESWRDAALAVERGWFESLRTLVERFGPVRLVLAGPSTSLVATLKRPSLFGRLRSAKPLATYA